MQHSFDSDSFDSEASGDWHADAEYCLDNAKGILREHEIEFLENILDEWEGDLTDNQEAWLDALFDKVARTMDDIESSDGKHRGGPLPR